MSDKAMAIIQARMSSTRLPGKVLKPLAGKPMIWHIVQRAKACEQVGEVVVVTSTDPSDDPLADFCGVSGIKCYRGELHNVLSRYTEVLEQSPHDYFVRITGDCPLIDPNFIDKQLLALRTFDADLVWLDTSVSVLEGQAAHSTRSLKVIASQSEHPDDLEHVGSRYLAEYPEEFRIIGMQPPESLSKLNWRITVDEAKDYEVMWHLYEALWDGDLIPLRLALVWLAQNSDVSELNKTVEHSAINQELAAKRLDWKHYLALYCDWNPSNWSKALYERH